TVVEVPTRRRIELEPLAVGVFERGGEQFTCVLVSWVETGTEVEPSFVLRGDFLVTCVEFCDGEVLSTRFSDDRPVDDRYQSGGDPRPVEGRDGQLGVRVTLPHRDPFHEGLGV